MYARACATVPSQNSDAFPSFCESQLGSVDMTLHIRSSLIPICFSTQTVLDTWPGEPCEKIMLGASARAEEELNDAKNKNSQETKSVSVEDYVVESYENTS